MTDHTLQNIGDGALAASLASSPAWVPSLHAINAGLTTTGLILGVALGIVRLWLAIREWRATRSQKDNSS